MPGAQQQASALILSRQPSAADAFEQLTLFSGEAGLLHTLRRIPQGKAASAPLDLFDEAEFWLESTNQGRTWFIKEHRLIRRQAGIGRSYESLKAAAALAALVSRNPVSDESREPITALLRASFSALAAGGRPDVTWLKALYCFLRDEGYPVKQQWWPQLPAAERDTAARLLNQPLDAQAADAATVAGITRRLEAWLRAETEVRI